MCSGAPSVRKTRPAPHRRAQWGRRGTACGGGRPRPRRAGRVAHTHPLHSRAHDLPAHRALYLEPSLGMETCISGLSATQTKKKKKGTRKTSWVPAPNPNSKHETRPSPWTAFCVEHHSFSKSSRLEERASRLVLTRTTCLEGHLVKKEEARHMSMERTECFENLKATPSVPGTWMCHPLPPNTGSPLGKAPSQSWPSLRLRRRPWDMLLALGCSATRTPGVWEGSSLRRAVTCDMGGDLVQTPGASKSQASAQRGGAARTRRGGRVSPACSQTRGALPDSQLSYGPIYRHSVNISFRSVDTKRKPEINLCRSDV